MGRIGVVRLTSQLCCAVLVGVALTVLVLELASRRLDGPAYITLRQAEYGYFTWFIGIVAVPTVVAVVMLVVATSRANSPLLRRALLALGLIVAALTITLAINGPINVQQLSWSARTPPTNWATVRDRWQLAHAVRTLALVLALVALITPLTDGRTET